MCSVAQLCPILCDPRNCSPRGSSVHGNSLGKNTGVSPTLQADSLLSEPPRKPKNTGVSSLSLLQRIFPTQESNKGLLHCRQILYCLSHQESPMKDIKEAQIKLLEMKATIFVMEKFTEWDKHLIRCGRIKDLLI